jgi:putative nucleotidyltransferase with HDIG domain
VDTNPFEASRTCAEAPWKVLIADDEPEVHEVTRLVLGGFRFEERGIDFLSAYSAADAFDIIRQQPDIAVLLLDVVMETEHAGLDIVRRIRRELGNHRVRIVLRTGQPGQAPEQEVISAYDINDYKEKTELTAARFQTTLFVALRGYRDLMALEASKQGLEQVIEASAEIFSQREDGGFAAHVLKHLARISPGDGITLLCRIAHPSLPQPPLPIALASPPYTEMVGRDARQLLPAAHLASLNAALQARGHVFGTDHFVLHFIDGNDGASLLYLGDSRVTGEVERKLLEVFSTNVTLAYKNLHLNQDLVDSQLEMIWLLAGAAETRSRETANHVLRVGLLAELLARAAGQDAKAAENLRLAAPLHDIGKIGIPDAILNKPGSHTPEETAIMRTHAQLGAQMLAPSKRPLLQLASRICMEHHENWDGSGYPNGLLGEAISLEGRIVALVDVFDALGSTRVYKAPWSRPQIREFLVEQTGRKFDPQLVNLLFEHWDAADALRLQYPDT